MGEKEKQALRIEFDRELKLQFHGAKITSDAGILIHRELVEAMGLTGMAKKVLPNKRKGKNKQHTLTALLRQSLYSRLAGYPDTNDADRLRIDPAMRRVVGDRAKYHPAALTSQMGRFETQMLASDANVTALPDLNGSWIDRVNRRTGVKELILDMDSSESPTHGQQEGSEWNGHFVKTCYHPLFCFNQFGDLERVMLREGNVHGAKRWRELLEPVVARYRQASIPRYFRGAAAFANPELYEFLEAEGFRYAIRLPANDVLYREIKHLLRRPVGRPSIKPKVLYHRFD